jgi:hypothetical protein
LVTVHLASAASGTITIKVTSTNKTVEVDALGVSPI